MSSFFKYALVAWQGRRYVFSAAVLIVVLLISTRDYVVSVDPLPQEVPLDAGQNAPGDTGFEYDAGAPQVSDADPDAGSGLSEEVRFEPIVDRGLQLALARICVSEAGFQVRTRDCELIYHVLRTRSRTGELNLGTMQAYCTKSFNRHRTDSHRWVPHLTHTFSEPRGWRETTTLPWSRRRAGFQEVYEFAGRIILERPSNPCGVQVDHWGARGFRQRRLLRSGWRIVNCGETLNTFWSLPSGTSDVDAGVN